MRTTRNPRDVTQLHVDMFDGHFTLDHSSMLKCGIWNGFIEHASYGVNACNPIVSVETWSVINDPWLLAI